MNIKKLFLLFLLSLTTSMIYSEINASEQFAIDTPFTATVLENLAGSLTGAGIGYAASSLFDLMINYYVIDALSLPYADKKYVITVAISLIRCGVIMGSKWYYHKPLRNTLINCIVMTMKNNSINFNEELMKKVYEYLYYLNILLKCNTIIQYTNTAHEYIKQTDFLYYLPSYPTINLHNFIPMKIKGTL